MTDFRWLTCQILGISTGLAVSVAAVLLLDRHPPIRLDASRSFITPSPANPGDTITITWAALADRRCGGFIIPRVIDSTGRIYEFARIPVVYHELMKPDATQFSKVLTLPTVMAKGPARYEAVVVRWCNVVQEYLWPMVDAPFPIPFIVK